MANLISNVVEEEEVKRVFSWTLRMLSSVVGNTFGPGARYSMLLSESAYPESSKDGHTVLGTTKFGGIIEEKLKEQINLLTLEIANTVGDGTTSAVILCSLIYDAFINNPDVDSIKPQELMDRFKAQIELIKEDILSQKQEFDADMAYKIAYIATNGNEFIAGQLKDLYAKYGNELEIEVMASSNNDTYLREYDGLTLETGMADICYQNVPGKDLSVIVNPEIYAFDCPIDTPAIGEVFQAIIKQNIIEPGSVSKTMTPTVILCPKIGYDYDHFMNYIGKIMNSVKEVSNRPPLLIITNLRMNKIYEIVTELCGCKWIRKVLNEKNRAELAKKNEIATATNFKIFAGSAQEVKADSFKTIFVAPKDMYTVGGDGQTTFSDTYNQFVMNLKLELETAERETKDLAVRANIRRTLHCLTASMVDFCVGGITVADRDALMHLIDDAVKSTKSAAKYGVGYAANYHGLVSSLKLVDKDPLIGNILFESYKELSLKLYESCLSIDEAKDKIQESIDKGMPYDLRKKEFNGEVLGSIMADVTILDTIAKILSLIITCRQVVLPDTRHMCNYVPKDVE